MKVELNERQLLFVDEYTKDFNATQAAMRAGYAEASAHSQAHDLLKKPEIAAAVAEACSERRGRLKLDADAILADLSLAATKLLRYIESTPAEELEAAKVNAFSRLIEIVAKHNAVGATRKTIEFAGKIDYAERLEKARKRVEQAALTHNRSRRSESLG